VIFGGNGVQERLAKKQKKKSHGCSGAMGGNVGPRRHGSKSSCPVVVVIRQSFILADKMSWRGKRKWN
jgi:hypothetical protein